MQYLTLAHDQRAILNSNSTNTHLLAVSPQMYDVIAAVVLYQLAGICIHSNLLDKSHQF